MFPREMGEGGPRARAGGRGGQVMVQSKRRSKKRHPFTKEQREILSVIGQATKAMIELTEYSSRSRIDYLIEMLNEKGIAIDVEEFERTWKERDAEAWRAAYERAELEAMVDPQTNAIEFKALCDYIERLRREGPLRDDGEH